MWPLPRMKSEQIHIILGANQVSCNWIAKRDRSYPAALNGHKQYTASLGVQDVLFNPTLLKDHLNEFLQTYKLNGAFAHIVLHESLITECIVPYHTSNAQLDELINKRNRHTNYSYYYLGSNDREFQYYVCTVSQQLICQLNIVCSQLPLHLIGIKSPFSVQVQLLKQLLGKAFVHTRIVGALDVVHTSIPSVFSLELIRRCLQLSQPLQIDDTDILYALGSYLGAQNENG